MQRPNSLLIVWAVLVVATASSWLLGSDNLLARESGLFSASAAIIVIALAKVWLVLRYFMEVRSAPSMLKRICDAWIAVVGVILVYFCIA